MPTTPFPTSVEALARALVAAVPELDAGARQVSLATYRLLSRGDAVTEADVAATTSLPVDRVADLLAGWPGVFRDDQGAIVGFWGLAKDPLDPLYRLRLVGQDRPVHAWCAWDTLFLPAVLETTLEVTAADGRTGAPISLTVSPHAVDRVDPAGTVVSFLAPDGPFDADVVAGFCHKVLFFADEANAAAWIADRPDLLFTLSVADAFEVGRLVTAHRFGAQPHR